MDKDPQILDILLDDDSHHYFTRLRNQYFPKHCNYLEAHLTLFHKLPSSNSFIHKTLTAVCKRPVLLLEVTAVKNIGNGVAFEVKSAELSALHKKLQQEFARFLGRQDSNKLWPHITIQNKVTAFKALQTHQTLQQDFKPFSIEARGIGSWLYKGGPWEKVSDYLFETSASL
ncbi:MAG: 2'-5' RNA ligase family protein [Chitinophagaceae bacterium]|nr:MAG: 2'-5' RNA ligase family protein [Chitinophagaceae bacterium]